MIILLLNLLAIISLGHNLISSLGNVQLTDSLRAATRSSKAVVSNLFLYEYVPEVFVVLFL